MADDDDPDDESVRTLVHGSLEKLITPRPEPGKACLIVIRGRSVGQMMELSPEGKAVIGRGVDVTLPIDDIAVSRRHASIEMTPGGFEICDLDSTNGMFVNGVRTQRHRLHDGDRIQIGTTTILKFAFQDELEADYQRELYDSATRDALTRTYNRKFFRENLDVDFAHAYKNGSVLSLLLLDLDHFKAVNDRFGHVTGDDVLRETAAVIQRTLRPEDILARYGGEEFAVLLRFTDPADAWNVAERIRRAVQSQVFGEGATSFRISVSVGQTSLISCNIEEPRELLEIADAALYDAKAQGRNRTAARVPPPRVVSTAPREEPPARPARPSEPGPKRASRTAVTAKLSAIGAATLAREQERALRERSAEGAEPAAPARPSRRRRPAGKAAAKRSGAGSKAPARRAPARKKPARKAPARTKPARKAPGRKKPARKAAARSAATRKK